MSRNAGGQRRSQRRIDTSRRRGERGFTLILLALCLLVMIGMLGLAIDLGKVFIARSELQTFVDAAALAAVIRLDGTKTGVEGANATAVMGPLGDTHPNGYDLGSFAIPTANVATRYSTTYSGTYDSFSLAQSAGATNQYRFINVTATANIALNFLPVLQGIPGSLSLSSSAVAGQKPQSSITNGGLIPFAPDAHDFADIVNFGLTPGVEYTLKWDNKGTTTCAGDAGFTPPSKAPSEHGFVDIGEGNGNSGVRDAITSSGYPNANSNPSSLTAGDSLGGVPGNRGSSIFGALADRAAQDTDDNSTTFEQYKSANMGNGRRIVAMPIAGAWSGNGNNASTTVLGFGNFFLNTSYSGSSGPICAAYIGPASLDSFGSGGTDGTKIYSNYLYR